mmetsp:Transcript_41343/g.104783  ORF Transcript_41343/g.104783 Transcript_41343/m.104783 type:complete len:217 (-) Transcript_41343:349-999(-)
MHGGVEVHGVSANKTGVHVLDEVELSFPPVPPSDVQQIVLPRLLSAPVGPLLQRLALDRLHPRAVTHDSKVGKDPRKDFVSVYLFVPDDGKVPDCRGAFADPRLREGVLDIWVTLRAAWLALLPIPAADYDEEARNVMLPLAHPFVAVEEIVLLLPTAGAAQPAATRSPVKGLNVGDEQWPFGAQRASQVYWHPAAPVHGAGVTKSVERLAYSGRG